MRHTSWIAALVFVVGCGGGDDAPLDPDGPPGSDGPAADGPADGPAGTFAITSPAFIEGAAIPSEISCEGANTSPQLDWVAAPAGTLSFAIVFTDKTNNLIHSVIYDIPANLAGLPADVEKVFAPTDVAGAHQTASYDPQVRGYNGPCPGNTHTYEFKLYALDAATLPGATMQTSRAQAKLSIEMHDLASATLSGMFTPQ